MAGRVETAPNRGIAFAAALFEEWERAGVSHVCICPGSRSAPLAVAAAGSALRRWTHLDERSAAFFALGLAKATREPVALVCTSGTAAVNFAPAVVEAHYARVPLLVLTADRPPELREWGAGQTIDQRDLFGCHVRWSAEVAVAEATPALLRYARALAARAAAVARGAPAGPVHLNLPFRDPLDPRPVSGDVPPDLAARDPLAARGRGARSYTELCLGQRAPSPGEVASLAERLQGAERGVIVCGPLDARPDAAAGIAALARRIGWPLLAEPTSQLRTGPLAVAAPLVATAPVLCGDESFSARFAPDFVLRFGAAPTSAPVARWIARHAPPDYVAVDPDALWHDPSHLVSEIHAAAPEQLCERLLRRLPPAPIAPSSWRELFLAADAAATRGIAELVDGDEALLEPRVVRELAGHLPTDALLYVSNSTPVRDLDAFWPSAPRGPRMLCNRGANGIDGMVSSALGAAAAGERFVALLCGDLALLHDVSGLLAAVRLGLPLGVVALDNDGGGIFSALPVADSADPATFTEHFRTPHGHDLVALCSGVGAACTRVSSWEHFRAALKDAASAERPHVIVVPTDADASLAQRRAVAAHLHRALAEAAR